MSVANGSLRYALLAVVAAAVVFPFSRVASGVCVVAAVGVIYFHRDPARVVPPQGVVAPADGKVTVVREEGDRLRLGIYMSGWDVHVNRAAMDGTVQNVEHIPGANKLAFTKDAEENERLRFEFEDYTLEQIAGTFARRTYSYVDPGQSVARGQRIGHISFGSRFDMVFPPEYGPDDLTVDVGHRLYGGETVIAPQRSQVTGDDEAAADAEAPDAADEPARDASASTASSA
ncbi:protein sorting system archaetidylserine decarboxylase [Halosimplex pelagicum]|uniref:Protein sorting system archaetidylserine decarboxylase n=1 Tax=Halosimplex pelagicum TaxID=869886 RepID=A0A7D5P9U8_9EURY|nr:protein sorting system archaetidylserine decarboxylase [Halosimplex pelagicum]QLH81022.1 protein sorting system archaetidylserine decarboxylase [Halosimplex pelagicum]